MCSSSDMNQKTKILNAAMRVAESEGFGHMRRGRIAAEADVSTGLINFYYGTIDLLRDAVMHAAVERKSYIIVAAGLMSGHPAARDAPEAVKAAARATLI